jgi:hypothetical protein
MYWKGQKEKKEKNYFKSARFSFDQTKMFIRGKHLHDRIISLRGEVWAHKTSLTPPLFVEVSVLKVSVLIVYLIK